MRTSSVQIPKSSKLTTPCAVVLESVLKSNSLKRSVSTVAVGEFPSVATEIY